MSENENNVVSIDMAQVTIERDAIMTTLGAVPAGHPHGFRFPTLHDATTAAALIASMCPRLRPDTPDQDGTVTVDILPPVEGLVA